MKLFSKTVNSFQPLTIFPKNAIGNVCLGFKYASEYYHNFFSWRFQIRTNDFLNFFSTINFSYQYPAEVKAYLGPTRTDAMKCFRIFLGFFAKFARKHLCRRPFSNDVIGFYPATLLKERTSIHVFSDEFCEIIKTAILQNTCRWLLLFYKKNILPKKSWEMRKMKTDCRKNKDTRKTKT